MRRPPPDATSSTAGAATRTTSAAGSPTKRSSTRRTAAFGAFVAARLLALFHLDPRPGLGHVRIRRVVGILRRRWAKRTMSAFLLRRRPGPPATSISTRPRPPTAFPIGTPAPGPASLRRLATRARPTLGMRSNRSDSSAAAIAAQGLLRLGRCRIDRVYASRADHPRDGAGRTVPEQRRPPPGPAAAQRLSSPNGWDYEPPGRRCLSANRACGATTISARRRSTCNAWPATALTSPSGDPDMIVADLNTIEDVAIPRAAAHRTWWAALADPGRAVLHRQRHPRAAGGQVPWHNQDQERCTSSSKGPAKCAWALKGSRRVGPGGVHSAGSFPSTHQPRRHALADDLLLRSGGRRGPWRQELAGTFPQAGSEAPPLPEGAWRAVHRETPTMNLPDNGQCSFLQRRISVPFREAETRVSPRTARSSILTDVTDSVLDSIAMEKETLPHVGIIMNGVTGRMGTNQHLVRSIAGHHRSRAACRPATADVIMPDPILVGRNAAKLEELAARARRPRMDHGPGRGAGRPATTSLLRRANHRPPRATASARPSPRASTSTAKSPRADQHGRRLAALPPGATRPASSTASCRTSSGCRAC